MVRTFGQFRTAFQGSRGGGGCADSTFCSTAGAVADDDYTSVGSGPASVAEGVLVRYRRASRLGWLRRVRLAPTTLAATTNHSRLWLRFPLQPRGRVLHSDSFAGVGVGPGNGGICHPFQEHSVGRFPHLPSAGSGRRAVASAPGAVVPGSAAHDREVVTPLATSMFLTCGRLPAGLGSRPSCRR